MKIRMEPELEQLAGHLTPAQRIRLADKLERLAHELRVTDSALDPQTPPRPPRALIKLSRPRQLLN